MNTPADIPNADAVAPLQPALQGKESVEGMTRTVNILATNGLSEITKLLVKSDKVKIEFQNFVYNNDTIGIIATGPDKDGVKYSVHVTFLPPNPRHPDYQNHLKRLASGEVEPYYAIAVNTLAANTSSNPPSYSVSYILSNRQIFGEDASPLGRVKQLIDSPVIDWRLR